MTQKQKLQKQRSWLKFQLSGIKWLIEPENLVESELLILNTIKRNISYLLEDFDLNSLTLGLKIPEYKCWCGKEGKYEPIGYPQPSNAVKVCKKHIHYD